MHLTRCPHCHGRIHLDSVVQDEAARELIALMAKQAPGVGNALVQYLTLFRPPKRDLANTRALKLAQEALELSSDPYLLAAAMTETVEAVRNKRAQGGGQGQPLKNHNYLRSVLSSVAERANQPLPEPEKEESVRQRDNTPRRADDIEKWRRQMRDLGHDPDELLRKHGGEK